MDVVDSCLKREKCEIKTMMWTSIRAQKVTIRWHHISVRWQKTPIWLQSAQKNNARLGAYVLKIMMT